MKQLKITTSFLLLIGFFVTLSASLTSCNDSVAAQPKNTSIIQAPMYDNTVPGLMRDYQIKITEDEQFFILYDGRRKVGVLPLKKVTSKMSRDKDDLSWLIEKDNY